MCPLLIVLAMQLPTPVKLTAEEEHRRLLKELGIASLRSGANGMDPKASNYANTDEARANPYPHIPELMRFKNGRTVRTAADWIKRRQELFEDFDREVYGRTPTWTPAVKWQIESIETGQIGTIQTVTKNLVGHVDNSSYPQLKVDIRCSLTTPALRQKRVPVVLEFGFAFRPRPGTPPPPAPAWQEQVLSKGWGYAILQPNTVQADNGAGLTEGIIGLVNKGQPRKPDDWGALKAWAWGAGRVLDYLELDRDVDAKRVAIEGLSRYGKAAIVTMAYEPRFSMAFVGSSGQGGVKIWRRNFGETVENVASSGEYHWMAGNYVRYAGPLTPGDLPVDAHMLVALCAPRPVFIGVGSIKVEGIWIDPTGTFMATALASPAYELLGKRGLESLVMPPEGTPLTAGDLAFSQHTGGHTNEPNWPVFLPFAERYWR
jgi:hypothetical protein